MLIAKRQIAAAGVAGVAEHHVHEGAAPQAAAPGRVGADVLARLFYQRTRGEDAQAGRWFRCLAVPRVMTAPGEGRRAGRRHNESTQH